MSIIINREDREYAVNNLTLEQAVERAKDCLESSNSVSMEAVFFMTLSDVLASEKGLKRLVEESDVSTDDFMYLNMMTSIVGVKRQLIENGYVK